MNSYGIGALEALSWTRAILESCEDLESFVSARREIEKMLLTLASGAAVNFKNKTTVMPKL